ncbi:MAG: putative toxin-antitoxin system toxin component, PIN family [Pontiellaceae bacterium]|jgi:putative PIN family toxin of toxin-antitoxin system|nr:putative toxin-antitoxin system toxin component, PIN family [Pontiellaceae bacterium]
MRVIIDANVAIAAAASRGLCEAVMELCLERHEIILGEAILTDIRTKLIKKIKVIPSVADEYIRMLRGHAKLYEPEQVATGVCRDPDDNAILGLVPPSGAEVIISGDQDLLVIGSYKGAKILSPRQFWEQNPPC